MGMPITNRRLAICLQSSTSNQCAAGIIRPQFANASSFIPGSDRACLAAEAIVEVAPLRPCSLAGLFLYLARLINSDLSCNARDRRVTVLRFPEYRNAHRVVTARSLRMAKRSKKGGHPYRRP
jgi:hypothetical protein